MLRPKRQSSSTITVTAPIGGWNAVNQLAAMSPNEAVIMDNWFCLPTELMIRKGYTTWATGISGNVQSFITYSSPSGTNKIFAASNNSGSCSIYDVSSTGAVGAAIATGLTSAQWHSAQMATSGGTFTVAVNGSDKLKIYNGTTWYNVDGTSSPYAITGVSTQNFADVLTHHRRLWFVEKNSLK